MALALIGKRHAEIIKRTPELELAAIVEPEAQSRQAAQHLQVPVYPELETMLAQANPDAVVLADADAATPRARLGVHHRAAAAANRKTHRRQRCRGAGVSR